MKRPKLSKNLDHKIFIQFYYLKEELQNFCKKNNISSNGSKIEITNRIKHYLKTGEILKTKKNKAKSSNQNITFSLYDKIPENFKCTEKSRDFFKSVIGSSFKFNVKFMNFLKNNPGQLFKDAVEEYYKIAKYKRDNKGKNNIDIQFEYNTYIRDFFNDNKNYTLNDAIKCWKYKKYLQGHNKYEKEDMNILK